ncbi:MAG: hypothetical protein FWH52_00430 [Synergistaceae bacterium]|nr:hypothetical protein [Synergistaceae bacterium]
MLNKEDIRNYFSRAFMGRIPVYYFNLNEHVVDVRKLRAEAEIHGGSVVARIVSPLKFTCGKLACVSSGIKIKSLFALAHGGRIKSYASGEIKTNKASLKFKVKMRKWLKYFALLPQERRNRLSFIPKKERNTSKSEFDLAYFQPIIHDDVAKLVLNKQSGALLIWYNTFSRNYDPEGLYMYKRFGEKDVDWRWVKIRN